MADYSKHEAGDWARENLRGQWSTLVTPFTENDEVDEPGLRANVRHVRALGTRGAGCTWGMGEFWALTHDERIRVYDVVADEAGGEWPIAAHVSHTSLKEVTALADHANGAGFDLLVLAAPYFVTKSEGQVVEFVSQVAEGTDLAIMFYNSPQFGIVLSAAALGRVCEVPNVVGVKEASFNPAISIEAHRTLGESAIISTPDEGVLVKGPDLGFEQQVMFANTSDWRFDTPEENHYVTFVEKAMSGDVDGDYYNAHIHPIKALSDEWWKRTVTKQNGALPAPMVKYWGELMGMAGGHVRAPLTDLTDEEKSELATALTRVRAGEMPTGASVGTAG